MAPTLSKVPAISMDSLLTNRIEPAFPSDYSVGWQPGLPRGPSTGQVTDPLPIIRPT
jgi:hypothetical protein